MEPMFDPSAEQIPASQHKPQFLKVLCILTFIWSGLLILVYFVGSLMFFVGEETAAAVMDQLAQTYPNIQIDDPQAAVQQIGKLSMIQMVLNIGSLVGAIMMWNLNKIGFIVYTISEIAANFAGTSLSLGTEDGSMAGTILVIFIDLIFIVMYALNLKYMNKNKISSPV